MCSSRFVENFDEFCASLYMWRKQKRRQENKKEKVGNSNREKKNVCHAYTMRGF